MKSNLVDIEGAIHAAADAVWAEIEDSQKTRWTFRRDHIHNAIARTFAAQLAAANARTDRAEAALAAAEVAPHDPAKVQALVEAGERMTGPLWRLILADEHCLKSPCDMPTCECRQKFDRIAGPWTVALAAMKGVM